MKGKNTLKLNQQTMQQAMQLWFDKMFAGAGEAKVTDVQAASGQYAANDFEVTVEVADKP